MNPTKFIWMDGKMVPWEEAKVHCLTHTFHYGGGAFEGVRCYEAPNGTAIFRLQEHVDRLFYSAKALDMNVPFTPEQIYQAIVETVKINEVKSAYIRPLIYLGYGKMGLVPYGAPVSVLVACWPWGALFDTERPIDIQISKYIRIHPRSTVADAKINGHYVNSILASIEMHHAKKDEALFLDFEGNVAEGPGENLFMVKDGKIYTPKLGNILAGITRNSIIQVAKDLGYEVIEKNILPDELYSADELFFTGTAAEVQPIGTLNGQKIGSGTGGEVSKKLRAEYMNIVQGKNDKYSEWLTVV